MPSSRYQSIHSACVIKPSFFFIFVDNGLLLQHILLPFFQLNNFLLFFHLANLNACIFLGEPQIKKRTGMRPFIQPSYKRKSFQRRMTAHSRIRNRITGQNGEKNSTQKVGKRGNKLSSKLPSRASKYVFHSPSMKYNKSHFGVGEKRKQRKIKLP